MVLLSLTKKKQPMAFEYLPIMAQSGAPKSPRVLVAPSNPAWCPIKKPLNRSRVALLGRKYLGSYLGSGLSIDLFVSPIRSHLQTRRPIANQQALDFAKRYRHSKRSFNGNVT